MPESQRFCNVPELQNGFEKREPEALALWLVLLSGVLLVDYQKYFDWQDGSIKRCECGQYVELYEDVCLECVLDNLIKLQGVYEK